MDRRRFLLTSLGAASRERVHALTVTIWPLLLLRAHPVT
jgi:hypothetical protein